MIIQEQQSSSSALSVIPSCGASRGDEHAHQNINCAICWKLYVKLGCNCCICGCEEWFYFFSALSGKVLEL